MTALLRIGAAEFVHDGGVRVALPAVEVGEGERIAVVGRNGCGKSTLLRVMAGLLAAPGGRTCDATADEIAWVGQRPYLFRRTVAANVALGARRGEPADEAAAALLDALGVAGLAHRPARELSEGQQARVALARAAIRRPRLLLLDEPFAALDADGARRATEVARAIPGVTIVTCAPSEDALRALDPTRVLRLQEEAPPGR